MKNQKHSRKPDPRVFQNALARLGLAREEVVYVGDSWEHDMIGARDAGIRGDWRQLDFPSALTHRYCYRE